MITLRWVLRTLSLVTLLKAEVCVAGECTESEKHYIADLASGKWDAVDYALFCLACYPADWRQWAGPGHAARLRECRESANRDALIQAAIPLITQPATTDSVRRLQRQVFQVLASWGVARVGSREVYDVLTAGSVRDHSDYSENMFALAGLRDSRVAEYIEGTYDTIRVMGGRDSLSSSSAALNCLYHIPGKKSVQVARSILEKETHPVLRERAERVVAKSRD